jgi:hypothetical protein
MPLWGMNDNETGNNKPLYSNTSTTFGVSVTERANTSNDGPKIAHTGWVKQTVGTGGRAGRVHYETLVAGGTITGDDPKDNNFFPGI